MNGVLYINGKKLGPCDLKQESMEFTDKQVINFPIKRSKQFNCTFTSHVNRGTIKRNTLLSLFYGRKITNNWLKMHGGVMTRKRYLSRKC